MPAASRHDANGDGRWEIHQTYTKGVIQTQQVDENNDGQRLDNFLLSQLKGVPRSWVYRVVRRGEVRVNKGRCRPARRLQRGDVVRIPPLRQGLKETSEPSSALRVKLEQSIIYEDSLILVINKPSGLAVHGGSGLSFGVIEALRALRPDQRHLELVHRDVAPENVMVTREGHAKVLDFGVAKAVSEATGRHQLTTVGVALGTPTYMAPE